MAVAKPQKRVSKKRPPRKKVPIQPVEELPRQLDPHERSKLIKTIETHMLASVIGQDTAIHEITNSLSRLFSGIRDKERPIVTMMFMGPTGVGKTETVKCLAEVLFGRKTAFTRINCQEFSQEFTISKLLGSPPGYVGGDIPPLLSQTNCEKHHKHAVEKKMGIFADDAADVLKKSLPASGKYVSLVLFDEIEKAHPKLWNSLLGILEDGHLTLGNNEEVDFTRSVIVLTSNVGSENMGRKISEGFLGFRATTTLDMDIREAAFEAAKKVFPYEFLNRFDEIVVYNVLQENDLTQILEILLADVQKRLLDSKAPVMIHFTTPLKKYLLKKGTDPQFGARPMKRLVEREIVTPLSNIVASKQVAGADVVRASLKHDKVVFIKENPKAKTSKLVFPG
ncbi:MAG: AAA family ATPase [Planctomycetes bacterium]|nr:AAA family ATPase [Planctomycetota bacterium]